MSPCFVFIDAPRAKSHSPGESLFLKERGKRDLRRRQSVACAAAAAMLPGVLQQLEGALEWARHTLDAGGRSERLARTEERNRLVQCAYLGHDGVAVRYMILGPADGIPIVMTPGGQMSGIDSIVGPRDERAMSAPLPDVVDAEYVRLGHVLAREHGWRILLHDRVNTGGSQFYLGRKGQCMHNDLGIAAEFRGSGEPQMQAFFLRELMVATGFSRAFLWGSSAGV